MMKRRIAAEFLGTFFIVLCPVFASSVGHIDLLVAAIISGLPVMAMIYALGPISAAHFNPAVTIAFASAGRFPWRHAPAYVAAQLLGGLAASVICWSIFGHLGGLHVPTDPSAIGRNIICETLISFLLMLVIVAVATDRRCPPAVPGLAIGLTVVIGVLLGGPITGGSMNPARSLGPAIVAQGIALKSVWLYFVGPILGATLAGRCYEAIRLDQGAACSAPADLG